MPDPTIQPTAANAPSDVINTTPNAPAAVSTGDAVGNSAAVSTAPPLLHPANESVSAPPQPAGSQTIQGLPSGFTVDAQAPPSASQVQGLPAGFTVDSQEPSSVDSGTPPEPAVDLSPITGFGKGIIETGQGLQHAAGLDNTFWGGGPESHIDTTANGTGEQIGRAGETLAEFLGGEGEFKLLSEGSKLLKVGKIIKAVEEYPTLARALNIGMGAVRAGVVGGAQTYAKTGGNAEQAVKSGLETGEGAGALGGAGELLGGASDSIASNLGRVRQAAAEDLSKPFAKAKEFFRDVVTKHPDSVVQPDLQRGIREVASSVADEATPRGITGEPTGKVISPAATKSIRQSVENLANAMEEHGKDLYAQIDQATNGALSPIQDAIRNVENKMRMTTGLDDADDATLSSQKSALEAKQEAAFKQAESNGVPRTTVDQARAAWRQKSAISDLDTQVKASTEGANPEAVKNTGKNPERINPNKWFNRLNKLYDSGRLQEAVGEEHANRLLEDANDAFTRYKQILRHQKVWNNTPVKVGAGIGSGLSALGGAYELAKHFVEK